MAVLFLPSASARAACPAAVRSPTFAFLGSLASPAVPARGSSASGVLHEGFPRISALRSQNTMARSCASARASCVLFRWPQVTGCVVQLKARRLVPASALAPSNATARHQGSQRVAQQAALAECLAQCTHNPSVNPDPLRQASLARPAVRGTFSPTGPSCPAAAVRLAQTLCVSCGERIKAGAVSLRAVAF